MPPADLASCAASTAETEDRWVGIVTRGGAAFGLSLDMPAYGEGATRDQIRMVVRYVRSLCGEHGWPPGELNFARGFLIEKAFPENELIAVAHAYEQQLIYERRMGRRFQFEAEATTVLDSQGRPFESVTGALKYNIWHSLEHRALATLGVEATPPLGRRDRWELAPYLSAGAERLGFTIQGQAVASWEEARGIAGASYRLGISHEIAARRLVPMIEAGWDVPQAGANALSLYPQLWIKLSRLGHVAGCLGAEVPVTGVSPPRSKLIAFLLWDFGDAPLLRGW
ncbi:MAG: hypothetical protein AUI89_04615 [Gemmatimonadetes bacterium 13_1_40CM_3_65_8]|nr:MAG: hypothetical protein AUI89_04615 [Gemmatimonadetes bacterium 13_1_40CM_3_65_8]